MANHPSVGTRVRYCHDGNDRVAHITEAHPDTGEVLGIAVLEGSDAEGWRITHGVVNPKPAATPQDRITHGHFWR